MLAEAGFTGERRVLALRGLVGHVTGALQLELSGPLSGPGTEAMTALDPTLFPLLSQTARDAGSVDTDREFLSGLRALLRGLDEGR